MVQQLAQAHITTTGSGNQQTFSGSFTGAQPTTSPVEFRLYGWNAGTSRTTARTSSPRRCVPGSRRSSATPINPTGRLTVQGDFYHLDGGVIAIDLGGTPPESITTRST